MESALKDTDKNWLCGLVERVIIMHTIHTMHTMHTLHTLHTRHSIVSYCIKTAQPDIRTEWSQLMMELKTNLLAPEVTENAF